MGDQIFERHAGGSPAAAVITRIDAAAHLTGNFRIIDRHLIAGNDHLHLDRKRFVRFAVVVEKRLITVFTVGNRADLSPRCGFTLVKNRLHRGEKCFHAVLVGQLLRQVPPQHTTRVLRGDVAREFHGEPRIVLDDPIDFLNRLALRPELDRTQLQTFHENIARARCDSADVDPMHVNGKKADQRWQIFARVNGRVHHSIIEMLTLYRGVIAYHDIAPVQTRAAVNREPIAHRHADGIGDEDRHPPSALRNEFTLRTHEPHRKIFVLVNIGAEGGARNVGIDLIRDRDQTVANHLESDRVERGVPRL